jgi:hypothetical protein
LFYQNSFLSLGKDSLYTTSRHFKPLMRLFYKAQNHDELSSKRRIFGDVDLTSDRNLDAVGDKWTAYVRGSTPFNPLASTGWLLFLIYKIVSYRLVINTTPTTFKPLRHIFYKGQNCDELTPKWTVPQKCGPKVGSELL